MILEEVRIKNFRSHSNTRVKFNEGITVIVGPNGSGKTSILEAINFALFRKTSKSTSKSVKIEDLIRRGAEKEGMEVSLLFHSNGKKYRVKRGISGRNKINKLYDGNGVILTDGEKDSITTREIEEKLRMRNEDFKNTMYIGQGKIDTLITEQPGKRKALVGRLIGTEDLQKAWESMPDLISEYEKKIYQLWDTPKRRKDMEEQLNQKKKRIIQLNEEKKIIDRDLKNAIEKRRVAERELRHYEKLNDLEIEQGRIILDIKNLQEKITGISIYEDQKKETEGANNEYLTLKEEIKKLENEKIKLVKYSTKKDQLTEQIEIYRKDLSDIRENVKSEFKKCHRVFNNEEESLEKLSLLNKKRKTTIQRKIEKCRERKKKFTSMGGVYKGGNSHLKKAINNLDAAEDKCPVCNENLTLDHKEKLKTEYGIKIEDNDLGILECNKEINQCDKDEKKLESQLELNIDVSIENIERLNENRLKKKNSIREISDEIKRMDKWLINSDAIIKTLSNTENRLISLEKGYKRYVGADDYLKKNYPLKDKFKLEINLKKKQIKELENEKSKIVILSKNVELKDLIRVGKKNLEDLQKKVIENEKDKSGIKSTIKENLRNSKKSTEKLNDLVVKETKLIRLTQFKEFLEQIRKSFSKDNLQKDLRVRYKPLIERCTREELDKFDLPYSDISITDDFNITVYGINGEQSVDMLSGGERIAIAIALRIGIAKAISSSSMELLMFDEPTIHLDGTRRRELVEIIKKLAVIPQTIIITHDKEFEGAADKLLEVKKVSGISQIIES